MRILGIVALIAIIWWVANVIMLHIVIWTCPSNEEVYYHVYYGSEIIKWINITAVLCGLTWLVRKAYSET